MNSYLDPIMHRTISNALRDILGGNALNNTAELLLALATQLEGGESIGGITAEQVPSLLRVRAEMLKAAENGLDTLVRATTTDTDTELQRLRTRNGELLNALVSLRYCMLTDERERGLLEANNRLLERARAAEGVLKRLGQHCDVVDAAKDMALDLSRWNI